MEEIKIYLLNPPFLPGYCRSVRGVGETSRGGTLYYPIWLSYCAAILDTTHNIRLVDAQTYKWTITDLIADIKLFNPDLIVIDTNFSSLHQDIITANQIKSQTEGKIVIVGPPASQFALEIIKSPSVDFVVPFEYDFTLKDLAITIDNNNDLSNVQGLVYKKDNQIIQTDRREFSSSKDLDELPFVSKIYKKFFNIDDYFLSSSLYPVVQIFTGRGCPNKCTFCSWPITLMGREYRTRSIINLLDELEWIEKNTNAKEVFFEDDTFTINKNRVMDFCDQYIERDLNIKWSCNARVNTTNYEIMKKMKRANCRLLIVGYESGSNEILKNIKKGITVEQSRTFAKNAKKAGLLVHGDFVIGLPGESIETIEMTRKLIKELKPEILQVLIPQPIPGTDLFEWLKQNKFLCIENPINYLNSAGYQKSIIDYPLLSNVQISKSANSILKDYYLSFSYAPIAMKQILRKGGIQELKRLFMSAIIFIKYNYEAD